MLRTKNKLTIFDDANSTFTDYSREALDFDRDTFTITLDASTSYLYVGFYKPINLFYTEVGRVVEVHVHMTGRSNNTLLKLDDTMRPDQDATRRTLHITTDPHWGVNPQRDCVSECEFHLRVRASRA